MFIHSRHGGSSSSSSSRAPARVSDAAALSHGSLGLAPTPPGRDHDPQHASHSSVDTPPRGAAALTHYTDVETLGGRHRPVTAFPSSVHAAAVRLSPPAAAGAPQLVDRGSRGHPPPMASLQSSTAGVPLFTFPSPAPSPSAPRRRGAEPPPSPPHPYAYTSDRQASLQAAVAAAAAPDVYRSLMRADSPASPSPPLEEQQREAEEQPPLHTNVSSVSALGRTLAAAASALTAAAQREREQEAQQRDLFWRAQRASATATPAALALLMELVLTEKRVLYDAFLGGREPLARAMEMCAVLHRRDAQRQQRVESEALLAQGREAQRRVSVYREHVAAAQSRHAAEEAHRHALSEAEHRVAELEDVVAGLTQRLEASEAQRAQQRRDYAEAALEKQAAATAATLEVRALQRAHRQATERWLAAEALHEAVQRHGPPVLAGPSAAGRVTRRDGRVDANEEDSIAALLRQAHVGVAEAAPQPRSHSPVLPRVLPIAAKAADAMRGHRSEPRASASSTSADEPTTALEVLLARTKSDTSAEEEEEETTATRALREPAALPRGATAAPLPSAVALGRLSSPPGTPLQAPSPAAPRGGPPARQPNSANTSEESDHDTAEKASAAAAPKRRGSSFSSMPSRLNSVASTRRGSSTEVPDALLESAAPPRPAHVSAAELHDGSGGSLFLCTAQDVAAAAVRHECARLLDAAFEPHAAQLASRAALHAHRRGPPPRQQQPSTLAHTQDRPRGDDHHVDDPTWEHLSVPRDTAMAEVLPVSAARWMRACEVAHTTARVLVRVLQHLQAASDSLAQRVRLLDDKSWNTTMARRFVAVEHAASLQRLVSLVEKLVNAGAAQAATR
ncbi:hypothetical protein NESM_000549200 [Novymonas esmeraldas]|uniref:Uncharacterized protein n=1 Tax=Novymonas esmeraldas TaxID=1808958 RepID=A0AAW0ETS8_9TRYP